MPEGLAATQIAVAACVVFAAFVVRGMSGFGAGMIGVPLVVIYLHMRRLGPACC